MCQFHVGWNVPISCGLECANFKANLLKQKSGGTFYKMTAHQLHRPRFREKSNTPEHRILESVIKY